MRLSRPPLGWPWFIALLAAMIVWGFVDVRRRGYLDPHNPADHKTDFTVYTEAGAAFFDGRPPYEVENPRGWSYLYPPIFAILLSPLYALEPQDQVTVWFFLSLLFCWGCYREFVRLVRIVDNRVGAAVRASSVGAAVALPPPMAANRDDNTTAVLTAMRGGSTTATPTQDATATPTQDATATPTLDATAIQSRSADVATWLPWLGVVAAVAAALPTLNCLQRGQVGVLKLYLLLLGVRLILGGRSPRAWLAGGLVLSMPAVMKIIPTLPVAFFLFLQFVAWLREAIARRTQARRTQSHCVHDRRSNTPSCGTDRRSETASYIGKQRETESRAAGRRFAWSTSGAALGAVLFALLIPAALVGWKANLDHLGTWADFMLTKFTDGGVDPRSGNSLAMRNQSLQNAGYRFGNFAAYVAGRGPDDRLVENDNPPPMPMDAPAAQWLLAAVRGLLLLGLLWAGVRLGRLGDRLSLAAGFGLACVAMLMVSPVARGHYFMLSAPAILFFTPWLAARGPRRTAVALALMPAALSVLHYVLLPWTGRIGLLGLGTACWLAAALALTIRCCKQHTHVDVLGPSARDPAHVVGEIHQPRVRPRVPRGVTS